MVLEDSLLCYIHLNEEKLTISDAITDSFEKIGQCVERFISAIPSGFELTQQILVECESHFVFCSPGAVFVDQ